MTRKAGVGDPGTGIGATWANVDGDGRLDLFVANYLTYDPNYKLYFNPDAYPGPLSYKGEFNVLSRNRGDGTFENISEPAGIRLPNHRAMSVCALDYDLDGNTDFYLCNDATPNVLLVNDGKGRFTEMAMKVGIAFNALGEAAGSMTAAVGDCNGDLLPDILVSRLGYGSLYLATPRGLYNDQMMASGLGRLTAEYVGWGSNFLDFDNDGDLDIFIANGDAHHLSAGKASCSKTTARPASPTPANRAAPSSTPACAPAAAPWWTSTTTARWTWWSPRWATGPSSCKTAGRSAPGSVWNCRAPGPIPTAGARRSA